MTSANAIRDRIKNLVARAEDAASCASEVEAALAHAQELMMKHGLTLEDITGDAAEQVLVVDGDILGGRILKVIRFFVPALAGFCGVEPFKTRYEYSTRRQLSWIGYGPDVELAQYLFGVITRAIMAESRRHHPPRSRDDFAKAMAARIGARLRALTKEVAATTTGDALVVVKDAAIRDVIDHLGLRKGRRLPPVRVDAGAAHAGRTAGDRVGLHRPVGGSAGRLALPQPLPQS